MPGEHRRWLYNTEHRSPAVPSLRQPGPQHPINWRESEPWTAETIDHGELVSECDDLQVQRCAGANEKAQRVKQRDDDGRHESRLSENVGNLDRGNADEVHGRDRRGNRVAWVPEEDQGQVRAAVEVCERPGEHERRSRNVSADRLDLAHVIPGKGEHPRCREERIA